jgi:hypothetical protein
LQIDVTDRLARLCDRSEVDGKSVSIRVTKNTTYEKREALATAADLKVGERVVVDATGKHGDFTAAEIRFSSSHPNAADRESSHEFTEGTGLPPSPLARAGGLTWREKRTERMTQTRDQTCWLGTS